MERFASTRFFLTLCCSAMTTSFLRRSRNVLCTVVSSILLLLLFLNSPCRSLSVNPSSSSDAAKPRGSAAVPFDKQKVAVLGAGGYLGACAFGFLQRCSSLYGSGIGSVRCIGATAVSSDSLNRVLGKNFILAYAGEDMVRLTDMTFPKSIAQRIKGHSAIIMGTDYYLEKRPVTANTYEKTPNDKTLEFFLDSPRKGVDENDMIVDNDYQSMLFQNTLQACQESGHVKHLIVVESPYYCTLDHAKECAKLLDDSKLHFTYLKINGRLENVQDYTFRKGIQDNLQLESFTFAPDYAIQQDYKAGSWMDELSKNHGSSDDAVVYREDVAALAVQCLQSLDWNTSRCIVVSSGGSLSPMGEFKGRLDKEWCVNSSVLAEKLNVVQ